MAHDFAGDRGDSDDHGSRDPHPDENRRSKSSNERGRPRHSESDRWPAEVPSPRNAHVVLKVDESITLKRTAAAAWLTAHSHALPALPIKPTRMELAVVIALAETYGALLYRESRFVPVIDFIADHGAVVLVQRVMYGARPETHFDLTARTAENARLADAVRDARVAFEFLCATWPEVFFEQTHAVLAGLGVRMRLPDADLMLPLRDEDERDSEGDVSRGHDHDLDEDDVDDDEEGDHA